VDVVAKRKILSCRESNPARSPVTTLSVPGFFSSVICCVKYLLLFTPVFLFFVLYFSRLPLPTPRIPLSFLFSPYPILPIRAMVLRCLAEGKWSKEFGKECVRRYKIELEDAEEG
jgi:hypothetical protein